MAIPETLPKLVEFLNVSELLEQDERASFVRIIKRLTQEEEIDVKLRDWTGLATDASWFKARVANIVSTEGDKKSQMQRKLFSGVSDKNTPKWQVEAQLESDPMWQEQCRRVALAAQLQIVADKVCEIALQSLRAQEALGNNQRFYGRVDAVQP